MQTQSVQQMFLLLSLQMEEILDVTVSTDVFRFVLSLLTLFVESISTVVKWSDKVLLIVWHPGWICCWAHHSRTFLLVIGIVVVPLDVAIIRAPLCVCPIVISLSIRPSILLSIRPSEISCPEHIFSPFSPICFILHPQSTLWSYPLYIQPDKYNQ